MIKISKIKKEKEIGRKEGKQEEEGEENGREVRNMKRV